MLLWLLIVGFSPLHAEDAGEPAARPARVVDAPLSAPDEQLDYRRAANAFDKVISPTTNIATTDATIERLVDAARQMAGPNPTDMYKLAAVRKAIYDAGPWNYNRAFAYDQKDPFGRIAGNRLLSTYVRTRQGNCVSMPTLFLIVAERLGLDVTLAAAPLHMFVRYTDSSGAATNLETTSGGRPARLEWFREKLPMTDRAIESGIYMRTLSKRESIALMAVTVVDFLLEEERYQEAIEVADMILVANPRDAYTMVKKGSAIAGLMQTEFIDKYPTPDLIPAGQRQRYVALAEQNQRAFAAAEALGWEPAE